MRLEKSNRYWRHVQACFCLLAALFLAISLPTEASAKARRASMVIDANTGKVLHASNADALRHPASLTKMMTLYMVFEEIESGRLSLDTKIRMTKWGAMAPPSKLGLKEGEEITVRDAIRALVTKSANDVARAVGEHIGGTEVNFAKMMTEKARLLGMSKSTFRNASGLPDIEQVTTARDMLTLALHLQDDFPQHYHFFSTRVFKYRGRSYRNHNALLRTYPGTDGLKTGYIRMSGFNVVNSVQRGGKHVVAVVFGGRTAASRNAEMRALLNRTIAKASKKKTRKPAPVSFYRVTPPAPAKRPEPTPTASADNRPPIATASAVPPVPARAVEPAEAAAPRSPAPAISIAKVRPVDIAPKSAPVDEPVLVEASTTGPIADRRPPGAMALGRKPSTLQDQAEALARGQSVVQRVSFVDSSALTGVETPGSGTQAAVPGDEKPAAAPAASKSAADSVYQVQVGAYTTAAEAKKALVAALERASGLLAEASPLTVPVKTGKRQLYRARFAGFDSSAARSTCAELRRRSIDCFVAKGE